MFGIRLSKQKKTIRIVNKEGNLRLSNPEKTIKVVNRRQDIKLRHTGKTGPVSTVPGPKGDKGDTGISTFVRSHHGSDQNVDRPNAVYVEWVGTVAPLNATTEDTWIHTPA